MWKINYLIDKNLKFNEELASVKLGRDSVSAELASVKLSRDSVSAQLVETQLRIEEVKQLLHADFKRKLAAQNEDHRQELDLLTVDRDSLSVQLKEMQELADQRLLDGGGHVEVMKLRSLNRYLEADFKRRSAVEKEEHLKELDSLKRHRDSLSDQLEQVQHRADATQRLLDATKPTTEKMAARAAEVIKLRNQVQKHEQKCKQLDEIARFITVERDSLRAQLYCSEKEADENQQSFHNLIISGE